MLRFDGVDDYIELGNLLPQGSYTKECWISAGFFGSSSSNLVSGMRTGFWAPNGLLRAGHSTTNGFSDVMAPATRTMNINTWYHVAVTYDASTKTLRLYQNGELVDEGPASGVYVETNLFIGAYNVSTQPHSLYEGRMDEVKIWNVVRTREEIAASMHCVLTGDEAGLIAYYDFQQGVSDSLNQNEKTLKDRSNKCQRFDGQLKNFALSGGGSNWSGPGAEAMYACAATYPNISITGNSVCIQDNDLTPADNDHTSFGNATERIFTIKNAGRKTLSISGVVVSSTGVQNFTVVSPPSTSLAVGASTAFTLRRTNTAASDEVAIVHVNSDDPGESDFNFAISAREFAVAVMADFTAQKQGSAVRLDWTTSSEYRSSQFRILRSPNGNDWTQLGVVTAAGNSSADQSYSFMDDHPMQGTNHYQLEIMAQDNSKAYSEVRIVEFGDGGGIRVYPVPARDRVVVELQDPAVAGSTGLVIDHQGRVVDRFVINSTKQEINVSRLPAGMYILRLENGQSKRFLKQ